MLMAQLIKAMLWSSKFRNLDHVQVLADGSQVTIANGAQSGCRFRIVRIDAE